MRRQSRLLTALLILIVFLSFSLAGCGQEKAVIPVTEPTLEVTEDGAWIAYLVESFDKDYYSVAELEAMVKEEALEYNASKDFGTGIKGDALTVESVAMAPDGSRNVVVALKFANSKVYADYFGSKAFFGTVEEAVEEGYGLSAALTAVEDGELFTKEMINKNKKKTIVIIEESVIVRCPKEVLYVGTNAELTKDGFVDCTGSEGLKLIITK